MKTIERRLGRIEDKVATPATEQSGPDPTISRASIVASIIERFGDEDTDFDDLMKDRPLDPAIIRELGGEIEQVCSIQRGAGFIRPGYLGSAEHRQVEQEVEEMFLAASTDDGAEPGSD